MRSPSPTSTTATPRRHLRRRLTTATTGSSASASTMPVAMRMSASSPLLTRPTTMSTESSAAPTASSDTQSSSSVTRPRASVTASGRGGAIGVPSARWLSASSAASPASSATIGTVGGDGRRPGGPSCTGRRSPSTALSLAARRGRVLVGRAAAHRHRHDVRRTRHPLRRSPHALAVRRGRRGCDPAHSARRAARPMDAAARGDDSLRDPPDCGHRAGHLGSAGRHQPADRALAGGRAERGRRDRAVRPFREHCPRLPSRGARDRSGREPQPGRVATGAEGRATRARRTSSAASSCCSSSSWGPRMGTAALAQIPDEDTRVRVRLRRCRGTAPWTCLPLDRARAVVRRRVRRHGRCAGLPRFRRPHPSG